jgi:hypothetical protein
VPRQADIKAKRDEAASAIVPIPNHAAPLEALATPMGLPAPTLDALVRAGKGPPVFKIGRRVFCRVTDFHRWLDDVASGKIDATLARKRRHIQIDEVHAGRGSSGKAASKRRPKRAEREVANA